MVCCMTYDTETQVTLDYLSEALFAGDELEALFGRDGFADRECVFVYADTKPWWACDEYRVRGGYSRDRSRRW